MTRRWPPWRAPCDSRRNASRTNGQLFWAKATLGDLEVLVGTPDTVTAAYKEAIAKNDKDWFALDSSRAQLQLLKDLGFRPDTVEAGIATFDRALRAAAEARRTAGSRGRCSCSAAT